MTRVGTSVGVQTQRMATGGEAVGRLPDGRVVFVAGALPGESVQVEITEVRKRHARGHVVQVHAAAPERIEPECAHRASGECGGCDWLHIEPGAQRGFKQELVVEQLTRHGGLVDPAVSTVPVAAAQRTTARCAITDGRAGFRGRRSETAFAAEACRAVHPLVQELIVDGRYGSNTQATIRVGAATGQSLVIVDGDPDQVTVDPKVTVVTADDPGTAAIVEEVAGHRWRVSAGSFFQPSPAGAEALVAQVGAAVVADSGPVIDLYAGVGLLGGAAAPGRLAIAVESGASSAEDARTNLVEIAPQAHVVTDKVERWARRLEDPPECETVIADPARRGLAAAGVHAIERLAPTKVVLVSCDLGSLGRDVGLLGERGWQFESAAVIDQFPDTSRTEVVSSFVRNRR